MYYARFCSLSQNGPERCLLSDGELRVAVTIGRVRHKVKGNTLQSSDAAQETGFERLFQEYWGRIYAVLFRMLGDPDEAEDLALETFWKLSKDPPEDSEALNLGGWLYRVATRLGYNTLRSRRRRKQYEQAAGQAILESSQPPAPDLALELAEQRRRVRQVLAKMPSRQAQVLVLRHSGLTYAEIAAALDVSARSVGTLLARAERAFEEGWRKIGE